MKLSLEHRKKIGLALKLAYKEKRRTGFEEGFIPWNKGSKGLTKRNSGSFSKGNPAPKTAFKEGQKAIHPFPKGHIPWNKGIKWEEMRGEKHPNWRGGKSKRYKKEDLSYEDYRKYKDWQNAVFERDVWTCQGCGKRERILHAHHIKSWLKHPKLRYVVENGQTLCPSCHKKTDSYSRKLN